MFIIYFWERERQRETEHEWGRGREREGDRIWSRFQALGHQHRAGSGAWTHEPRYHDLSQSQKLNWQSYSGTPEAIFLGHCWPFKCKNLWCFSVFILPDILGHFTLMMKSFFLELFVFQFSWHFSTILHFHHWPPSFYPSSICWWPHRTQWSSHSHSPIPSFPVISTLISAILPAHNSSKPWSYNSWWSSTWRSYMHLKLKLPKIKFHILTYDFPQVVTLTVLQ